MRKQRRRFLTQFVATGVGSVAVSPLVAEPTQGGPAVNLRLFTFVGGATGPWSVIDNKAVIGDPIPVASRLEIISGAFFHDPRGASWVLRGVTSNERYITRHEKEMLVAKQVSLGRPTATHSALIPIRKNAKWWSMTQDERRAVLEEQSHHIKIGLKYLPTIARRLHHCRDLGENEPFDFLTLFDYAKEDAAAFEELVGELRASAEWQYVEREVDIRLVHDR